MDLIISHNLNIFEKKSESCRLEQRICAMELLEWQEKCLEFKLGTFNHCVLTAFVY